MAREELSFQSGRGRCDAWLFRPEDLAPGQLAPCVVMGSGFSCVRDQGLDRFGERFAAAGIAALVFDYRHWGTSSGEPRQLVSKWRQQRDWREALARARSLEGIDPARIAVWGFSYGGGHAQWVAASDPRIRAAIAVAPLVDSVRNNLQLLGPRQVAWLIGAGLRDVLRAARGAEPHLVPVTGPPGSRAYVTSPDGLPGFQAVTPPGSTWRNEFCARSVFTPQYRPGRRTRRIVCPILFCVPRDDGVVPPGLTIRASRRAPRGDLRIYPGGHFEPFLGETFERVVGDQIAFLQKHLM